jgi:hypothetical protein
MEDLKNFYHQNIDSDRNAILQGLRYLTGKDFVNIGKNFDEKIKPIMDNFNYVEDRIIKNNFSYNMGHMEVYESYTYEYYLK